MSRFWVGGATGFLGSHLLRVLKEAGHEIVAVSRTGGEVAGVEVHAVDILDGDAVQRSALGCDGAFLAAGKVSRDPADAHLLHQLHVLGTRHALAALRRAEVPRVVYASTSGVVAVGTDPERIYTESDETPLGVIARWPYYRSKLYAEQEAMEANQPPDFEVVVVNPSLLLGPGDTHNSSTGDVRKFLDGDVPAAPAGGLALIDVRDAARATLAAFERGRAGERYLLSAKNMTVRAFFERLERLTGVKAPVLRLPRSRNLALFGNAVFSKAVQAIGGTPPVEETDVDMGQHFWYCDSSKARAELGLTTRDVGETLKDTVEALRGADARQA